MKVILALLAVSVVACMAAPSSKAGGRLVYYYHSREGEAEFNVATIDASLCTHLVYASAILDPATLTIAPENPAVDIDGNGYADFVALKQKNPNLKLVISMGGYADSNSGSNKYSELVSSSNNIANFVNSVISFLNEYKFDGLDLDWEYPSAADKLGFGVLINQLHTTLDINDKLFSVAIPAVQAQLEEIYDIIQLDYVVDFVNLMSYDMHGSWEPRADHHAPLNARPGDNNVNIKAIVNFLLSKGMTAAKINLGIPMYGRSWTLASTTTVPPCPANGAGNPGDLTGVPGFLAYYEICRGINAGTWTNVMDPADSIGPYAYTSTNPIQWVSYDDVKTVQVKSNYVVATGLGGVMVWDISTDDFTNACGAGKNPLLTAISKIVV